MKLIALLLMLSANAMARVDCSLQTSFCNVKYNTIYDGDTFYVDIPSLHPLLRERFGIRVRGIDAPEIRTKNKFEKEMAYKSKDALQGILRDSKQIRLYSCSKGKYFRLVCDAEIKTRNKMTIESITAWMLKNGYAVKYK